MTWRTEPGRSRILILSALTGAVLIAASVAWAGSQPRRSGLSVAAQVMPFVLIIVGSLLVLVVAVWSLARQPRWGFLVQPGAFGIGMPAAGLTPVVPLLFWGLTLGNTVSAWLTGDAIGRVVYSLTLPLLTGVLAGVTVLAWQRNAILLTPAGIEQHIALYHRTIPWEALAPGGPLPPHGTSMFSGLQLMTLHPALVRESGWAVGAGTAPRPVLPAKTAVHPWLLAGAIRWYAEHPEHRAAIGTAAEHGRLLAAIPRPA